MEKVIPFSANRCALPETQRLQPIGGGGGALPAVQEEQGRRGIRLALPDGCEVNVERTPSADERYADLDFALDNAIKRARRGSRREGRASNDRAASRQT
jgi:hypothetical protein